MLELALRIVKLLIFIQKTITIVQLYMYSAVTALSCYTRNILIQFVPKNTINHKFY